MASTKSGLVRVSQKDYLVEDEEIPSQKYVCLSFISPEDVLARKDVFLFEKFVEDRCAKLKSMVDELATLGPDCARLADAIKDRHAAWMDPAATVAAFDWFRQDNEAALDQEFLEKNDFKTSVRGLKVRGSYPTLEEAQERSKRVRDADPKFDVYVASVGAWCQFSPSSVHDVEYAEDELNTLMKKYNENMEAKAKEFSDTTATKVANAIAEGKTKVVDETEVPPESRISPESSQSASQVMEEMVKH